MELLRLENVSKNFGGLAAVNKVSLSVQAGESFGIVGPNGSGKTTLYNLISGVYKPDEGKIYLAGKEITNLPPHARARLGIARTFQIPRPFNSATVLENVAVGAMFGRAGAGVNDAFKIAERYLELMGIEHKKNEKAMKLTPLEKRLVEIARALAMKPELLLLDEVMAGMNPGDIDRLIALLKRIKDEENISIIAMVEHLMHAITKFAGRLMVMHQGKKLIEGETFEVLNNQEVIDVYLGRKMVEIKHAES